MKVQELQSLLRNYGLRPNFTYGQNFLLNETVLQDMVDSVPIDPGDAVLEIGPGIGNLTERLLQKGAFVLSVEKDKSFLPVLKKLKRAHKNFRYEFADILEFDFSRALKDWPSYKVVANIPYFITGLIMQTLLQARHRPKSITLLVQKEVAQNIIARPGQMNLLAISVQLYGEAKIVKLVPAGDFYPQPKVDSALLHIELFVRPKYQIVNEKKFFRVVRACFSGKRKQLQNTLADNLRLDKKFVAEVLAQLKISPAARPQELGIGEWINLVDLIEHQR